MCASLVTLMVQGLNGETSLVQADVQQQAQTVPPTCLAAALEYLTLQLPVHLGQELHPHLNSKAMKL